MRCVSNQDWVTTAETCECAMAHLAAGDRASALALFEWVQRLREPDGSYLTGRAFPANVSYPDRERTTYSAAAVLLAADAPGRRQPHLRPVHRLRLAARPARSRPVRGTRPRLAGATPLAGTGLGSGFAEHTRRGGARPCGTRSGCSSTGSWWRPPAVRRSRRSIRPPSSCWGWPPTRGPTTLRPR